MTAALLFASTFLLVFFLGLQSLLVNNGHRAAAFVNSFFIGASNLALYKLAPDAAGIEVVAYLSGGPFGIVTSMIVHRRVFAKKSHQDHPVSLYGCTVSDVEKSK